MKPAFEDFVLPSKKYADVIIPRGGENHVAINLIVQHIHTKLGQHDLCKIYPNVHVIQSTFQVSIFVCNAAFLFPLCAIRFISVKKQKYGIMCLHLLILEQLFSVSEPVSVTFTGQRPKFYWSTVPGLQ